MKGVCVYRRTLLLVFGGSLLALVALFAALIFSADTLAAPSAAPPGGAVVAQASPTAAATDAAAQARPLERRDWVNHVPLFCAMTLLVILVDAAVIGKIVYDRARARRRPAAQV
jgi:hypothetical protein